MDKDLNKWLGKIHNKDCVAGMKKLPAESIQLVFADPPFNIGYDYDEYDDRLESEKYLDWSRWARFGWQSATNMPPS
jgi:DNA modification methylase